jgi:signal transduction histidine kinase
MQTRQDGAERILAWWCCTLKNSEGKIIGALSTARDITEKKLAEEELKKLNEQLNHLIDSIKNLTTAHDIETVQKIISTSARTLTGADGATIVLRDGEFCYYADEDAISPLWKGKRFPMNICISGWVILNHQSAIIENIYKDPRIPFDAYKPTFVNSLAMVPINTIDPIGAIGNYWADNHKASETEILLLQTLADASARTIENVRLFDELERRVEERTAQLESINNELEAFTYSVSHDLRAPLRAIEGYARILTEDYGKQLDKNAKRICNVIINNTAQLSQLIQDLLDFSKLSRVEIKVKEVNMETMVKSIISELINTNDKDTISFEVDALPVAVADQVMLKQVWYNLISNAIKFSSCKNKPKIKIGFEEKDKEIIYYVSDNGVGFDMQYANKLFGVFQRLHSSKDFEGTGVGLAIVQRIVQHHGGLVWANGEVNKGATFYFSLPRRLTVDG